MGLARILRLSLIGAVQFGFVYLLYLNAFSPTSNRTRWPSSRSPTPLFVILLDAGLERHWNGYHLLAAGVSIVGAGVLVWSAPPGSSAFKGFLLIQASNVCFAAGQIAWRKERLTMPKQMGDASVFAILYAGALLASVLYLLITTGGITFTASTLQLWTILYLGVVASGLGFFPLNKGATQVNAGTLAAFNNAKIPLGIACSLLVFGESADMPKLIISAGLMGFAVWIAERKKRA